jgi:hypothetical protein
VVIVSGVDVLIADTAASFGFGAAVGAFRGLRAVRASRRRREAGRAFYVDVHLATGLVVFEAADHPAGGPVKPRETGDVVAGEHTMNGRRVQLQDPGDPGRSQPSVLPQLEDQLLDVG